MVTLRNRVQVFLHLKEFSAIRLANLSSRSSQICLDELEKRILSEILFSTACNSQDITILSHLSHWPSKGEVTSGLEQVPSTNPSLFLAISAILMDFFQVP